MEVVGMIDIVVNLGFRRPGYASVIRVADVGVGVVARRILVEIADVEATRVSSGLVDSGHGKRKNSTGVLRWNRNEEGRCVDAEISNDIRGTESGAAVD